MKNQKKDAVLEALYQSFDDDEISKIESILQKDCGEIDICLYLLKNYSGDGTKCIIRRDVDGAEYVALEGEIIEFKNTAVIEAISHIVSNIDIYPLRNNSICADFAFYEEVD